MTENQSSAGINARLITLVDGTHSLHLVNYQENSLLRALTPRNKCQ